jgi:translation initiation factor IF-2
MKGAKSLRNTALLLILASLTSQLSSASQRPIDPVAVEAKIASRGVGQGVRVTLQDGTEVKGMIVSIGDQDFVVKAKNADLAQTISYAQVTGVHRGRLSTGYKVLIGVGILGVAGGIFAYELAHSMDDLKIKVFP